MSYDLLMFDFQPGMTDAELEERMEAFEGEIDTPTPDSAADERNSRIEAALDPPDYLTVDLDRLFAELSFPYWDTIDLDEMLAAIQAATGTIQAETGWNVFDPQLGRAVDVHADAAEIKAKVAPGIEVVQHIAGGGPPPERRSLWQRLFGRG